MQRNEKVRRELDDKKGERKNGDIQTERDCKTKTFLPPKCRLHLIVEPYLKIIGGLLDQLEDAVQELGENGAGLSGRLTQKVEPFPKPMPETQPILLDQCLSKKQEGEGGRGGRTAELGDEKTGQRAYTQVHPVLLWRCTPCFTFLSLSTPLLSRSCSRLTIKPSKVR